MNIYIFLHLLVMSHCAADPKEYVCTVYFSATNTHISTFHVGHIRSVCTQSNVWGSRFYFQFYCAVIVELKRVQTSPGLLQAQTKHKAHHLSPHHILDSQVFDHLDDFENVSRIFFWTEATSYSTSVSSTLVYNSCMRSDLDPSRNTHSTFSFALWNIHEHSPEKCLQIKPGNRSCFLSSAFLIAYDSNFSKKEEGLQLLTWFRLFVCKRVRAHRRVRQTLCARETK